MKYATARKTLLIRDSAAKTYYASASPQFVKIAAPTKGPNTSATFKEIVVDVKATTCWLPWKQATDNKYA